VISRACSQRDQMALTHTHTHNTHYVCV
jgi:hypothetical protein